MGRKCMVPDCLSEEGREEDRGVTFHKIPLHSDIRPKWMSLCHIPEDKHNIKVVHVCSRHFLKADFCRFKGKKYMLRQGVLPSVFPWSKLKIVPIASEDGTTPKKTAEESSAANKAEEVQICEDQNLKVEEIINSSNNKLEMQITSLDDHIDIKEEIVGLKESSDLKEALVARDEPKEEVRPSELPNSKVEPPQGSSTTIEQQGKSIQTAFGALNLTLNSSLEALDFNQIWLPARMIEIDYEENEVLIHFEKYSSKHDEWINMNSSRLRPVQDVPKDLPVTETFSIGEKCMASWSGSRKFPATVRKIISADTYEVLFNDGTPKILKAHRIAKADARTVGSAPLFDPAEGTKQDRRDKKRKINVAELFRKRPKTEITEEVLAGAATSAAPPLLTAAVPSDEGVASSVDEPECWIPKWENGRPIGMDAEIETNDGMRKSIIVADPRLPQNWQKHLTQRVHGASAGKWDTVIVSPEGRKFRTRTEIKAFLEENSHLNYSEAMFDFSLHKRNTRTPRRPAPAPIEAAVPPESANATAEPAPEEENSSSLKIPLIDDVYKCPIEGCGKNFRRENLAQMHVKHYHPKYTKYLDSTPNVADLAYARTVGESLDKSPERILRAAAVRQVQKSVVPKASGSRMVYSPSIEQETKSVQLMVESQASQLQKTKDSEILKLLNSKPSEDTAPKYPPGLPSNMYPDIKLKDLLNRSEGIPKRDDLNLKSLSASTVRPTGIKTLLPVVRSAEKKESELDKGLAVDFEMWSRSTTNKQYSFKQSAKRKRLASENIEPARLKECAESAAVAVTKQGLQPHGETASNYIVEGGEVIKIVRMKREEIINCTCGIMEEDGLMIQCELCMCWQHAYCNNIERENQVPDKYICYICQNPVRQRSSRKYYHDQDWLKNGTLPVASYHCKDNEALKKRFEKLKKLHDMSGSLVELKDFMNSLKVKIKIAEIKNHPKLYLWSKPWEKHPLPEKTDIKQEEEDIKPKLPPMEETEVKTELDLLNGKTDSQNDSMLLSILKSTKDDQKLKDELDLNTLIDNSMEQLPISAPIIPQPEAAIDSADCKLNLLDHIAHCQTLVEERLNNFEQQLDALEGRCVNSEDDFNNTCQTLQMLLRDLNTLKELSHSNSL